jgi:hypothetical protein
MGGDCRPSRHSQPRHIDQISSGREFTQSCPLLPTRIVYAVSCSRSTAVAHLSAGNVPWYALHLTQSLRGAASLIAFQKRVVHPIKGSSPSAPAAITLACAPPRSRASPASPASLRVRYVYLSVVSGSHYQRFGIHR